MGENNRLTKVSSVIKAYGSIMRAHRGEVSCTVTTAKVRRIIIITQSFCNRDGVVTYEYVIDL